MRACSTAMRASGTPRPPPVSAMSGPVEQRPAAEHRTERRTAWSTYDGCVKVCPGVASARTPITGLTSITSPSATRDPAEGHRVGRVDVVGGAGQAGASASPPVT